MNLNLEDEFDDFTLEEAKEIEKEIGEVTIDQDIKDRYIKMALEKAGIEETKGNKKRRKRHHARWIQIAASLAIIAVLGTTTAFAKDMLQHLSGYFSGDVTTFTEELSNTIKTATNGKDKIEVKGAVFDENLCMFAFNMQEVKLTGKTSMWVDKSDDVANHIKIHAKMLDGTEKEMETLKMHGSREKEDTCVITITGDQIKEKNLKKVASFIIDYNDMQIVLDKIDTGKTIPLKGKGNSVVKDVKMSPITVSYFSEKKTNCDIVLLKKDGTEEPMKYGSTFSMDDKKGKVVIKDYDCRVLDLEKYKGIRINGEEYLK